MLQKASPLTDTDSSVAVPNPVATRRKNCRFSFMEWFLDQGFDDGEIAVKPYF